MTLPTVLRIPVPVAIFNTPFSRRLKFFLPNSEKTFVTIFSPNGFPKYLIKVVYQREKHPNVYVLDPKPLTLAKGETRLKHVYNTEKQHLCIYYKRAKEWDETQFIADTIIPWTSEWLLHYEIWVATGIWHGGGIH